MSQNYPTIADDGSGEILTDLASMLDRDEALRSHFEGLTAPSNPVRSQLWKDLTTGKWKVCTSTDPDVWTDFLPFLPTAGGALAGQLQLAEGTAVASAATVDLTAVAGNFVHITGTTNISAMTLGQGTWMLVCFDGILTITNGGALINQSGANIVTAAGDLALMIGEGGGVTRMVTYCRANGRPLSAILAAIAGLGSTPGVLYQTSGTAVTKLGVGVADGTDLIYRDAGDARYQAISTLLTALVADDANTGLIEQTAPGVIAKRAVGVAAGTDILSRADGDGRYLQQGSFNLSLPAGAWVPRPTGGCANAALLESTTNYRVREVCAFDGTTREHMSVEVLMPKSYSGGTIKYRVHWECSGATTGDARFGLQAASLADNETIDMAYGSAVEVTDSHNGSGKRMVSAWSSALTPSGTPAGGENMAFQFYRKADDAADTINGIDVQVVAVELLIPVSAADDT